jgi:hypothetical protein
MDSLPADVKGVIIKYLTSRPKQLLEDAVKKGWEWRSEYNKKESGEEMHRLAGDCFSLQLVSHRWRQAIDSHCKEIWPLVWMFHHSYNGKYVIEGAKYRSAMWCRLEEKLVLQEIHRILVEQKVVYRTKTGRKGDHTKLGFKKLPMLAAKIKKGREYYRQRCRDYKRLHGRYLSYQRCREDRMEMRDLYKHLI